MNFTDIDEVKFVVPDAGYAQYAAGAGGTGKPFYWQQQYAFAMDDLGVTGPRRVPDAGASVVLLSLGLLGVSAVRRRIP